MQKNILTYCGLLLLTTHILFAAPGGFLKGKITDKKNNEELPFSNIKVLNPFSGTAADINGQYSLPLAEGTYTVEYSYVSYQTQVIENVVIKSGETTIINVALEASAMLLNTLTIQATRTENTEASVVSTIKENTSVVSGVSSQQISKTQDRDAGEVVKRISGISITDNRFIIVRGLSQRYNNVFLNNAPTPSSEADIRAFSFDVLPGSQIENIYVYKSPMADIPADFSGGFIKIATKNLPDSNGFSLNYSMGYTVGTTFHDKNSYKGSPTDWLGFDNGTRKLPSDFPANITTLDQTGKANATKELNQNWKTNSSIIIPDQRFSAVYTGRFDTKKVKIGNFTALNYRAPLKTYHF